MDSSAAGPVDGVQGRLDSWKGIAAYLGHDIRTVQRWELIEHMPVHRHVHLNKSSVYAYPAELDRWWVQRVRGTSESPKFSVPGPAPLLWAAGAAAIVLAAGIWLTVVGRQPARILETRALTAAPGLEAFPDFSPDGSRIAYVWQAPGQEAPEIPDIYVANPGGGDPVRLTTTPDRSEISPKWSPDGRWIAYYSLHDGNSWLMTIPASGGHEKLVYPETWSGAGGLAWTSDSRAIIAPLMEGPEGMFALFHVSLDTGQRRRLLQPPPHESDIMPAFSADGRTLAFLRVGNRGILRKIFVVGFSAGHEITNVPQPVEGLVGKIEDVDWIGGQQKLIYTVAGSASGAATGFWTVSLDRGSSAPSLLFPVLGAQTLQGSLSPDGKRLAYKTELEASTGFWRVPLGGNPGPEAAAREISTGARSANNLNIDVSPNGRSIAFASNRSGGLEIWRAGVDGSFPRQITNRPGEKSGTPRWSPDGNWISFDGTVGGNSEIFVNSASGGNPRRLTHHPAVDCNPSWSADGHWLYFGSNRDGDFEIYKIPISGGNETQLTHNGGFGGVEPPEAGYFYYTNTFRGGQLKRVPIWGGVEESLYPGIQGVHSLRATKRGVYFLALCPECQRREQSHVLRLFRFPNGPVQQVAEFRLAVRLGFSVSRDDKFFVVSAIRPESRSDVGANIVLVEGLD